MLSLLSLISLAVFENTQALSVPKIQTHNIAAYTDNQFQVNGPDPFITFSSIDLQGASNTNEAILLIDIEFDSATVNHSQIPMELFFKPSEEPSSDHFDPMYRIKFLVQTANSKSPFALALPRSADIRTNNKMRLDLEQCSGCRFTLRSLPTLVQTRPTEVELVKPQRVYNGINKLGSEGLTVSTVGWSAKGLAKSDNGLQIDGADPYLISPPLDASTEELGGVHFRLSNSDKQLHSQDFQLFYATERHGFIEGASTVLRAIADQGTFEFVVPLSFLNKEHPRQNVIERLRLDLAGGEPTSFWKLDQVTLLHTSQLEAYSNYIPKRRLEAKQQRASGFRLIAKSISKVASDLVFTVAYLLLLLATAFGFWRAYRK